MRDRAIRGLYPDVVSINAGTECTDIDGKPVEIDEAAVESKIAKLSALVAEEDQQQAKTEELNSAKMDMAMEFKSLVDLLLSKGVIAKSELSNETTDQMAALEQAEADL